MRNQDSNPHRRAGRAAGWAAAWVTALAAAPLAASAAPPVAIADAWVRATPPGVTTAAAYLTITTDDADDRLVGASSDASREVQLHAHVMENGMARMVRRDALPITANAPARLAPGGDHLMLIGLAKPLAPGETIELTLELEHGGSFAIEVPVIDGRGPPPIGQARAPGGHAPARDGQTPAPDRARPHDPRAGDDAGAAPRAP